MSMKSYESQSQPQPAPTLDVGQGLREFWRLPSLTIARFTLFSYIRSGWILVDIVFVWLLYAIFFFEFGGNVSYFFGTSGQGLGALAIVGTVIMTQRAMNARIYLPLSRITSRSSYIRGLVIASGVLRVPSFLLLLLLASSFHQYSPPPCTGFLGCISGATIGDMIVGSIGLLANCMLISTLVVAFSAPIATRLARIVLLAWLAVVLYSNGSLGPVAAVLSVTRIPLIPLTICYSFGTTSNIGWYGLTGLVMIALYIVGFTLLAEYWMRKRDLILH
jgi:hypothetical protein